ncbi:hypothetical protein TNCV_2975561 [Trichonephila clavipes]|nr:hypothetical protein TNCV_2975561 [Trichonephila clavipes]
MLRDAERSPGYVYGHETRICNKISETPVIWPNIARISYESKCTKQSNSRRVFTWRENGACLNPSYVTEIDRFGSKEIFVCGGIMLGSHTPLYVFNAGSVNSQRKKDEILEAKARLFWVL